jgi:transposase-like protein
MNDNATKIICPDCGSSGLQKYGTTKSGKQKYRCAVIGCRRQFVPGSDHLINPELKSIIIGMIAADIHPRKIYKSVNPDGEEKISLRWIYKLRRRMKNDRQIR